jgi:transposase
MDAATPVQAARVAGLDWATRLHAVCVLDPDGQVRARFEVPHTGKDLRGLTRRLAKLNVTRIAIERPDGPVVEALLGAGLQVVVIASRQVKALRTRYGSAGNKDDRFDAYVLADVLRTDTHRLVPLRPDSPETAALRAVSRARKALVEQRVALANQLRANLLVALPAAVTLFAEVDSPISLAFLRRFPSVERAAWLTPARMAGWLRRAGYCGRTDPAELYQRLRAGPDGLTGPHGEARAAVTASLVTTLDTVRAQISELDGDIVERLATHTDQHTFTSLPRSGQVRAAALLAEIGDCRQRFPDPESLACLAGAAPSTRASGQHRAVTFRFACDKQLRNAVMDFAGDSRHANPWAAHVYHQARARGHRHPHAVRILARAWLRVIWRCWQDHTTYDPTRHGAYQRLTTQQT